MLSASGFNVAKVQLWMEVLPAMGDAVARALQIEDRGDAKSKTDEPMMNSIRSACILLLRSHGWDVSGVQEKASSVASWREEERLRISCLREEQRPVTSAKIAAPFTCPLCCSEINDPATNTFDLGCGHRFCTDCWRLYLETNVKAGSTVLFKNGSCCPMNQCDRVIPSC